jgi:hypothetical protein
MPRYRGDRANPAFSDAQKITQQDHMYLTQHGSFDTERSQALPFAPLNGSVEVDARLSRFIHTHASIEKKL